MIKAKELIELFRYALENNWGYIWGTAGIKWTKAEQANLEKTTDSNRAQGRKYGSKWIGHTVADCSGLFSWAFKKLGGYMYHGSDTMYRKYCADHGALKKGKRADGAALKPGTAVFVWNGEKYSHVGLFVGGTEVIEAMSTINGVKKSKVTDNKWSHWGELTGVSYEDSGETEPKPEKKPTLRKGSKGSAVKELQAHLIKLGYDLGKWGADGDFGNQTELAVKAFQKANGLTQDGVVGEKTWEKLDGNPVHAPIPEKKYKVTISGLKKEEAEELKKKYTGAKMEEE